MEKIHLNIPLGVVGVSKVRPRPPDQKVIVYPSNMPPLYKMGIPLLIGGLQEMTLVLYKCRGDPAC